jgi:hypothetical protein
MSPLQKKKIETIETPQIEDYTERKSAFPIGPCMYVRGGGLWAKHMGSK